MDDAYVVFGDRINLATHFRLSANRQRAELLEALFPMGWNSCRAEQAK